MAARQRYWRVSPQVRARKQRPLFDMRVRSMRCSSGGRNWLKCSTVSGIEGNRLNR